MAIVHKLQVPNSSGTNVTHTLGTVHYIVGTGTTAGTWLGTDSSITEYYDGLTIAYKLNVAGASTTTLNINGLGAKTVYNGGTTKLTNLYAVNSVVLLVYTTTSSTGCWQVADYDTNTTYTPQKLGFGFGVCTTAAGTAAKEVTLADYTLVKNGFVVVRFDNAVTSSSSKMNINSAGAKAIYYNGLPIGTNVILAGDVCLFVYDGTSYHLLTIDRAFNGSDGITVANDTIKHSNSVAASTAKGDDSKTLSFGGTFTIPTVTYDAQGHITAKGTTTMTMPANPNVDTKVTQTKVTTGTYPVMLCPTGQSATTTTTACFDSGLTVDANANSISATSSAITGRLFYNIEGEQGYIKFAEVTFAAWKQFNAVFILMDQYSSKRASSIVRIVGNTDSSTYRNMLFDVIAGDDISDSLFYYLDDDKTYHFYVKKVQYSHWNMYLLSNRVSGVTFSGYNALLDEITQTGTATYLSLALHTHTVEGTAASGGASSSTNTGSSGGGTANQSTGSTTPTFTGTSATTSSAGGGTANQTTGENSGTGVTVVTGVASNGTTTALTGVKASSTDTFVKTISGGSGSLEAYDAATNGTKKVSNGTRIPFVTSISSTKASGTSTSGFLKSINGGSGSLTSDTTATNGITYVESVSHTAASLTGTKTFNTDAIKSIGGTKNYGFSSTTNYVMYNPRVTDGVLIWSIANAATQDAHTGAAATTGTVGISGGSISTTTKYLHHTHTGASAGTTASAITAVSGGTTTATTHYLAHGHTAASAGSSGSAVTAVAANGTATVLTGVKASGTATVAPNEHTHTYTKPAAHTHTVTATGTVSGHTHTYTKPIAHTHTYNAPANHTHTVSGTAVKES